MVDATDLKSVSIEEYWFKSNSMYLNLTYFKNVLKNKK